MTTPAPALNDRLEQLQEEGLIFSIDEDLLPTIAARSDVIDPVGDLDTCRSWHG